jgi:pyrimidine deaminase RibD-like protein
MGRPVNDEAYMRMALTAGRRALPDCLPNPPVGCILVRHGEVIGSGYTQAPGADHAEAMALRQVQGDLSDVTVYVSLEPCSFHGRTPACALTLIERGVRRVIVALIDPDPRNAGKGIQMLRTAGVSVQIGLLKEEAAADLGPYLALPDNAHVR